MKREPSREPRSVASALGKNDPFALTKSDPLEEHDLPRGKKNGQAISSTPKACGLLFIIRAADAQRAQFAGGHPWYADQPPECGAARFARDSPVAKTALPVGKSATPLAWW
jgi:hypothetical protein